MVAYAAYLEIAETFSQRTTARMVAMNLEINSKSTLRRLFQLSDFLAESGLRDEEPLRSSAKVQFAGQHDKRAQFIESRIHTQVIPDHR